MKNFQTHKINPDNYFHCEINHRILHKNIFYDFKHIYLSNNIENAEFNLRQRISDLEKNFEPPEIDSEAYFLGFGHPSDDQQQPPFIGSCILISEKS